MGLVFVDGRTTLARNPDKTFKTRKVSGIKGIVLHHSAGGDNPEATARYHAGPNHISDTGCPGLCYTFYIRLNGETWWANDLDARTWSQGGHGSPVAGTNANTNFLGICCGGDFDAPGHKGKTGEPPIAQTHAAIALCLHLTGYENHPAIPDELFAALGCPSEALWAHAQFGKAQCPGFTLQRIADATRYHLKAGQGGSFGEVTDTEWQQGLVDLGYDLGSWGPNKDGVDGDWGAGSKRALVKFQTDQSLTADGLRGPISEAALVSALAEKGLPDPRLA